MSDPLRAPLWGLSGPPDSSCWPRLMTGRHPRAVGSYGPELIDWATSRKLHPKRSDSRRWWQQLVAHRALEHDERGELVWPTVIVSAPRQTGKSWIERDVCAWRIHQADRFGEEQTLLHTAHKLVAAQEIWRPAARWAIGEYGHGSVRWANGEERIELDDGSRWMIQAANDGAGVAFALSMVLVDEAWRIPRLVVDEAITPTMAEAASRQLWLVSTAGTSESDLMQANRAAAMALLDAADPGSTLLIEWSAPADPELDIDDPTVWRAASPHWDARREQRIREARASSEERAFRQQWLNQWVPTVAAPLLGADVWARVATETAPAGQLTFGVEITADRSSAVIVAYGDGVIELVEQAPGVSWVAPRLLGLADEHRGARVALDRTGPAVTVIGALAEMDERLVMLSGADASAATGLLFDAMTGVPAGISFRAHPLLEDAVMHARKRTYGQRWTWLLDEYGAPLRAASAALWAATRAPVKEVERSRIFI